MVVLTILFLVCILIALFLAIQIIYDTKQANKQIDKNTSAIEELNRILNIDKKQNEKLNY